MEILGFTGTKNGMTGHQIGLVREWITDWYKKNSDEHPKEAHHGCCIGADENFHQIVRTFQDFRIHGHPGIPEFGPVKTRSCKAQWDCNLVYIEKPFLERDHDIVNVSHILLATPKGMREELRSGTWATIRYAKKSNKRTVIFWPDGTLTDDYPTVVQNLFLV